MQYAARLRHRSFFKKGILHLLAAAGFHTGIRTQLTTRHFFDMNDVKFGRFPIYSRYLRPHSANYDVLSLQIGGNLVYDYFYLYIFMFI